MYGPLPEQLKDANSFAVQLKRLLAVRKKYKIEQGELIAAPETHQSAVCILVMRVSDQPATIITTLNFGRVQIEEEIDLQAIKDLQPAKFAGKAIFNCVASKREGTVGVDGKIKVKLDAWSAKMFSVDGEGEGKSTPVQ